MRRCKNIHHSKLCNYVRHSGKCDLWGYLLDNDIVLEKRPPLTRGLTRRKPWLGERISPSAKTSFSHLPRQREAFALL